jgi:L-histidine Nalpha-methyltransferase
METHIKPLDVLLAPEDLRAMLARDVSAGLARTPKAVRSRWVWDAHGSELFERICELPTYDLPRRERSILERRAGEVAGLVQPETLVELGSGSSVKTLLLLDELVAAGLSRFVALDVSEAALRDALPSLAARYPDLDVRGVVGDFERQLGAVAAQGRTLVVFLGSTIGALERDERQAFLDAVASFLGPEDAFLLGIDLVKPAEQVVAAYAHPDELSGGLTLNFLAIANRELGADFDLSCFIAESSWNDGEERLEMVARSLTDQVVTIPALDLTLELPAGETIRTQVSTKFRRDGLAADLSAAGLQLHEWWTDEEGGFAVGLVRPAR